MAPCQNWTIGCILHFINYFWNCPCYMLIMGPVGRQQYLHWTSNLLPSHMQLVNYNCHIICTCIIYVVNWKLNSLFIICDYIPVIVYLYLLFLWRQFIDQSINNWCICLKDKYWVYPRSVYMQDIFMPRENVCCQLKFLVGNFILI